MDPGKREKLIEVPHIHKRTNFSVDVIAKFVARLHMGQEYLLDQKP